MREARLHHLSVIVVMLCAGVMPAAAQTPMRPAQYEAELPDDSVEAIDDESSGGESDGIAADGDLVREGLAREGLDVNALLRDGLMDDVDPRDEPLDPAARPDDDGAVFAVPEAAIDPLLFQIEDIDPIAGSDRRPARLALLEPYDPLGVHIGSFVLFPEAEIAGRWTSNVFSANDAMSDQAIEAAPAARLVSNWSRHALELRGAADLSWFDEFDGENDRGYVGEARGRLDITRRTNLQALVAHEVGQEGRSAIDASLIGERTDIETSRAGLTFNHRFNRLRVQLRGALADIDYAPSNGFSNAERDVEVREEGGRVSWEFKPTLTAFVDASVNQRDYGVAASDGLSRSSDGERLRAGFDLGSTSRTWRGEFSVGWGRQNADAPVLGSAEGFLADANLAWRPTALTSLLLTARSEIEDTIAPGVAFAVSRSAGVEVRHALRRHVVASAGISHLDRAVENSDFEEDEWRAGLGLEYFLSREAIVFGRYQHIIFNSTQPDGDWIADEVRVGLRLRR